MELNNLILCTKKQNKDICFHVFTKFSCNWSNQILCSQSAVLEDDTSKQEIEISPNPAINIVQITDTRNSHKDFKVEIYDIMGNIVKHFEFRDTQKIDISDLVIGMYFFDIQSDSLHRSIKIMKID